jgi:acylpyruvate hydrolase
MRFASCSHEGREFAALIEGDQAFPLVGLGELGRATGADVLAAAEPTADGIPLSAVTLRPVIPAPGKIVCVGLNYLAHVGETGRDIPEYPVLFTKFAATLTGPFERVPLPPESDQVDFEGELAVVIGRAGRRIPKESALDHVGGYSVANDVTMRDYQYKTHQWLQGKAWERSSPLGPFLVTADEVGDPGELELRLTLNGEEMQAASTAQLMFDVPTLVSRISEFVSLEPGDVLLTGTPGGVGFRREPQVFIRPGDRAVVEIDRVGRIENEFFAEDPAAS